MFTVHKGIAAKLLTDHKTFKKLNSKCGNEKVKCLHSAKLCAQFQSALSKGSLQIPQSMHHISAKIQVPVSKQ